MSLREKLGNAFLEGLEAMKIYSLNFIAINNLEIIKFLQKTKIVDEEQIKASLEKIAFSQARNDYDCMVKRKNSETPLYPDHVGRPELLAYAIEKDIFTEKELKKIPFDHGENPTSYAVQYQNKNLLETLFQELTNPKTLPVDYVSHHECTCCGDPSH